MEGVERAHGIQVRGSRDGPLKVRLACASGQQVRHKRARRGMCDHGNLFSSRDRSLGSAFRLRLMQRAQQGFTVAGTARDSHPHFPSSPRIGRGPKDPVEVSLRTGPQKASKDPVAVSHVTMHSLHDHPMTTHALFLYMLRGGAWDRLLCYSASLQCLPLIRMEGEAVGVSEGVRSEKAARAVSEELPCISCSCCCPFRHAHRDEVTNEISILCGNAARSSTGVPPKA